MMIVRARFIILGRILTLGRAREEQREERREKQRERQYEKRQEVYIVQATSTLPELGRGQWSGRLWRVDQSRTNKKNLTPEHSHARRAAPTPPPPSPTSTDVDWI